MTLPYGERIHVIINPAAGQDRPILGKLNTVFHPAGVDWEVFITKKTGDARRLAQQAVAAGVDVVAVYGGDGTIAEVASALVGHPIPLAIFTGGTANIMSAELGIPYDLVEAAALTCRSPSRLRTIDMGQIGDHYFLQRVGVGLEAKIVANTDRSSKMRLGWLAYALSAFQILRDPLMEQYILTLDGQTVHTEGLACLIANSGNLGLPGFSLAPTIDIDDGLLDVIVINQADLASLLSLALSVIEGSQNFDSIQHWQVHQVTIDADPPQTIQSDGEVLGHTPLTAKILPHAIQVIVPDTD
jgi:YegS/Rv2252/BmrU family lipid kinase